MNTLARYDYSKLLGRMRELGKTQEDVEKAAGMSASTLNRKLNTDRDFNQTEMKAICVFLGIDDIGAYFFTPFLKFS